MEVVSGRFTPPQSANTTLTNNISNFFITLLGNILTICINLYGKMYVQYLFTVYQCVQIIYVNHSNMFFEKYCCVSNLHIKIAMNGAETFTLCNACALLGFLCVMKTKSSHISQVVLDHLCIFECFQLASGFIYILY